MNLSRLAVFPIVCVAAITILSGCVPSVMAEKPNTLSPGAEAESDSIFSDRLEEWMDDRDEARAASLSTELSEISEWLGVEGLETPGSVPLSQGWVAVAPMGTMCFVAVGIDNQTTEDGSIAVTILGREYSDPTLIDLPWSSDYDWLKAALDEFEPYCDGGPLPDLETLFPDTETNDQPGVNA